MADEARKRTLGHIYNKQLQHFKPSRAYRRGVHDDINAWKETQKKAEPVKPSELPDEIYGIKTEIRDYTIPPLDERKQMRRDFEEARAEFLKDLARNHADKLKEAGVTKRQISAMKNGKTPAGFNTHHIMPIHGGGDNDFKNLCLMKLHPYHEDVHNHFINPQLRQMDDGDTRKIKIPVPVGPVYIPSEKVKQQVAEEERAKKEKQSKNDKPKTKTKPAKKKKSRPLSKIQRKTMSKVYGGRGR